MTFQYISVRILRWIVQYTSDIYDTYIRETIMVFVNVQVFSTTFFSLICFRKYFSLYWLCWVLSEAEFNKSYQWADKMWSNFLFFFLVFYLFVYIWDKTKLPHIDYDFTYRLKNPWPHFIILFMRTDCFRWILGERQ